MTNRTKNIIVAGVFLAILLATMYFSCEHGRNSILKHTGSDTTIYRDSIQIKYKPVPYKVEVLDTVTINGQTVVRYVPRIDTSNSLEVIIGPADTAAIIKRLSEIAYYDTTINLKADTVRVIDTVSMNRIVGRQIKIKSADTTIKTTTILKPKAKLALSFTTSLIGNFKSPVFGQGVGLQLKTPNNESYSLQLFNIQGHRPMLQVTKGWVIRFKKKPSG